MASLPHTTDRDTSTHPVECDHRMRVVGRLPVGDRRRDRLDCDQPLRVVCRDCDHLEGWRCDSYGCAPCGESKRRRLERLIADGSAQHLANGLHAYFLTVTAPGDREHLGWIQGKRRGRRQTPCACGQHGLTMGEWNRQESACWNRLRTAIARDRSLVYVGAVEPQKRGALHRHVVLFTDTPLLPSEAQELALAAGYGCVSDLQPIRTAGGVANYVSKYVPKGANARAVVPWTRTVVDRDTGEVSEVPMRATFRLWSAAQGWGITMKQITETARTQARARARYLDEFAALLADDVAAASMPPGPSTGPEPPV